MKAMIFAAGIGSRLRPLTDEIPKALVEVDGIPMIERVLMKFKAFGITEVIINVHHHAEKIIKFLKQKDSFGLQISISDESECLLDTGGGLWKASWFFDDNQPFLVHNVDVLSGVHFDSLLHYHLSSPCIATLAVSDRATSRYFLFDNKMNLGGWENQKEDNRIVVGSQDADLLPFAFSGIQIVDPAIFRLIQREGKFSIVDVYLEMASNHIIKGMKHSSDEWIDMGKLPDIERATLMIQQGRFV